MSVPCIHSRKTVKKKHNFLANEFLANAKPELFRFLPMKPNEFEFCVETPEKGFHVFL